MYVLFDIGGTKTRVALTEDLRSLAAVEKFDTPHLYAERVEAISRAARRLAGSHTLIRGAGGVRGRLLPDHGGVERDSTLKDGEGKPLAADLGRALGTEVLLENDAALAGLGEAHFGAGQGYGIVAYHTVSTGVGGARIDHGRIDAESRGFEPGKQLIDADRTLCPSCESGQLEDMVSGTAVEHRFGKKPYEIAQSDPLWDQLAHWLAMGLKNTIVYWSPESIILGGSMVLGNPKIRREDIERHLAALLGGEMQLPPIAEALLGDEGGLYGAMVLLGEGKRVGE